MNQAILANNFKIEQNKNSHDLIIATALKCLEESLKYETLDLELSSSEKVSTYLKLALSREVDEVFAALFLNNQNKLIKFEKLFYGTIDETPVYPRKIVKKSLDYNAAKIIIAHNHPSGNVNPSRADKDLTNRLKSILDIIDVCLLDHIIVSGHASYSFSENHLI